MTSQGPKIFYRSGIHEREFNEWASTQNDVFGKLVAILKFAVPDDDYGHWLPLGAIQRERLIDAMWNDAEGKVCRPYEPYKPWPYINIVHGLPWWRYVCKQQWCITEECVVLLYRCVAQTGCCRFLRGLWLIQKALICLIIQSIQQTLDLWLFSS